MDDFQILTSQNTQINSAIKASNELVKNLHRDGLDRGCIATFNNSMVVRQVKDDPFGAVLYLIFFFKYVLLNMFFLFMYKSFTKDEESLYRSLNRLSDFVDGNTRLYDSMIDIVKTFHRNGDRTRPWILIVVTDGDDNYSSRSFKKCAAELSSLFTKESSNFLFVVGVGDDVDSTKMEQVCHFLFVLFSFLLVTIEFSHGNVIFCFIRNKTYCFNILKSE